MNACEITRRLGGDWSGSYGLCPGPGHSRRDRSMKVWDGPDGVLVHSFAGDSWKACRAWLVAQGLLEEDGAATNDSRPPARRTGDADNQAAAMSNWRTSRAGAGTPAESYLRHLGITLPVPPTLRYNPGIRYDRSGLHLPCMVCAVQAVDRTVTAIHRIWIRDDGRGKAGVTMPRKSLGPVAGGAVRLTTAEDHVALAESVEDGMALMQMTGEPVWSAPSASHLKSVVLPEQIRRVTIAPDNDPAGRDALEMLGNRLADEGRDVRQQLPPDEGQDWCDLLPPFEERAALASIDGDAPVPDAEMMAWYDSIGGLAI